MGRRARQTARRVVDLGAAAGALLLLAACPAKSSQTDPTDPSDPRPTTIDAGIDSRVEEQVAAIAAAMNHYGPAIHTCWAMAAADDFRVEGKITLRLDLGAAGKVARVEVESDDAGDKVLTECLVALWQRVEWPEVFAAGDSIRLPPLSFVAPDAQYVVASAHATSYPIGKSGNSHATILVDYKNTGNSGAAMTALTLEPGLEVPLHQHNSTEVLYVLKGAGELTSTARKPTAVTAGTAIYIPAGAPHAFNVTSEESVVALQLYAPGGAEQRFKGVDVGGTTPLAGVDRKAPAALVKRHADVARLPIAGATVSLLFDAETAPDGRASVGGMTIDADAAVPMHHHESSTELLFVLEGGGTLTVAGLEREVGRFDAIQIPPGVEHGFKNGSEVTKVVQFYSPSGPEQRFKSK